MKTSPGKYNIETDELLASLIADGNVDAFNELYSRYSQKIFSYFFRMMWKNRELAEDFTQELFVKILRHAYRFNNNQKFSTWLYSIAHNMCKNEYRKVSSRMKHKPTISEPTVAGTEKQTDLQRFKIALGEKLRQLPDEKRHIFILRFEEQLSVPDISQIMNLPEGTIKSRIFYLLKDLKEELIAFKSLHIYP